MKSQRTTLGMAVLAIALIFTIFTQTAYGFVAPQTFLETIEEGQP